MSVSFLSLFVVASLLGILSVGLVALIVATVRARRRSPGCGKCGYDVKETIGREERCPECGSLFAEVGITPPGRGRTLVVFGWALGVVLVFAIGTGVTLARYAATRAMQARGQAAAMAATLTVVQANAMTLANAGITPTDELVQAMSRFPDAELTIREDGVVVLQRPGEEEPVFVSK